jgi:hypothetical protein
VQRFKERLAGREQMFLSDKIFQTLRPHAVCEWGRLLNRLARGFLEQIHSVEKTENLNKISNG